METNTTHEAEAVVNPTNPYLIPFSIVAAGLLIAGAVLWNGRAATPATGPASGSGAGEAITGPFRPVSANDHILGNPAAPVKIVEYSDLECPYCKRFHATMQEVLSTAGSDGSVAWVYRHFPLDSIHPKARGEATAAECAGELGGNQMFWRFIDEVFAVTPSNNGLDPAKLGEIAKKLGLDSAAFEQCRASGRYDERIERDFQEGVGIGVKGTPWSIVIGPNDKKLAVEAAVPKEAVIAAIEAVR